MTEFAKFTRRLRIDNDEYLGNMARRLGVSSAFLSRIENGFAKPSEKIVTGLCEKYSLSPEQQEELKRIVTMARQKFSLSSLQLSPPEEQLVIRLAQSIKNFDEHEIAALESTISQKETR